MKQTQQKTQWMKSPATANGDAHEFLTNVSATSNDVDPMTGYQETIGEMLRDKRLSDCVKMQAAETLADLVLVDPAQADANAMRRLGKFVIHGPEKGFDQGKYHPQDMMTKAIRAMTGYADTHEEMDWEEPNIFERAAENAARYNVPKGPISKLKDKIGYVIA